jgi:hypothetical protein
MSFWEIITNHRHYWGVPHKEDNAQRIVQICYGCGKVRDVKIDLCPHE